MFVLLGRHSLDIETDGQLLSVFVAVASSCCLLISERPEAIDDSGKPRCPTGMDRIEVVEQRLEDEWGR